MDKLVLAGLGILACWIGARVIAHRWGLDSTGDAVAYLCAVTIPLPGRSPQALIRASVRRANGLYLCLPSGVIAAYGSLTVSMSPLSLAAVREFYDERALRHDLAEGYLAQAHRSSWQLPPAGVTVTLAADERLARGRLFVTGRPAPLPPVPRRAYAPPPAVRADAPPTVRADTPAAANVTVAEWTLSLDGIPDQPLTASKRRIRLGRDPRADVRCEHESVSRQHARLDLQDGRWWITDVGSSNGTFVGTERLVTGRSVPLSAGTAVRLGASGPYLRLRRPGESPAMPRPTTTAANVTKVLGNGYPSG
jgi:pSer/pThr/pTyr-binding forkhead associated (FHA) protein